MDELHPGYLVGLLVLLVACSAFFSCVETALLNLDRYRLRLQAKQGLRGARRSSWLLLHDDRLRGTLLFGRTLVNVSAAALASWAALHHWGVIGLAVAIPGMTLLLLLFGALLPRRYSPSLGTRRPAAQPAAPDPAAPVLAPAVAADPAEQRAAAPARRRRGGTGRQRTQPRRRGPASGRQSPGQRGQPA